jgi:ribosomal protein L37AE/L43A
MAKRQVAVCPYCSGANTVKKGKRENIQRYACKTCLKTFEKFLKTVNVNVTVQLPTVMQFRIKPVIAELLANEPNRQAVFDDAMYQYYGITK